MASSCAAAAPKICAQEKRNISQRHWWHCGEERPAFGLCLTAANGVRSLAEVEPGATWVAVVICAGWNCREQQVLAENFVAADLCHATSWQEFARCMNGHSSVRLPFAEVAESLGRSSEGEGNVRNSEKGTGVAIVSVRFWRQVYVALAVHQVSACRLDQGERFWL